MVLSATIAMGLGLMPHVQSLGGRLRIPELHIVSQGASVRCALRHPRLLDHLETISISASSDDALLAPRHSAWIGDNCLSRMRMALRLATGLPRRVCEAGALHSFLQNYFERSRAGWLHRRAGSMWGYVPSDGQLRLLFVRLRMLSGALRDYVEFATLRIVVNAWLTTRRMSRRPERCIFRRFSVGGDCVTHYFVCLVLARAIRCSRAAPPCRIHIGHIGLATFAVPLPQDEAYRVGVWNYVAYLMYSTARRRESHMRPAEVEELARACIRSAASRAPAAPRILAPHLA